MCHITVSSFTIEVTSNVLRFNLSFSIDQTATEATLGIPSRIFIKLMKKTASIDSCHLYADMATTIDGARRSSIPPGTNQPPGLESLSKTIFLLPIGLMQVYITPAVATHSHLTSFHLSCRETSVLRSGI